MKKQFITIIALIIPGFFLFNLISGFRQPDQKTPWIVPDKYKNMKSAVASNSESVSTGKSLYATHCKSCHGSKGLGDGSKSAQLKTSPGDFSTAGFQSQSDGSLFYKTLIGRDDMPGFKKKISDEDDIWAVVNFLRTLKK